MPLTGQAGFRVTTRGLPSKVDSIEYTASSNLACGIISGGKVNSGGIISVADNQHRVESFEHSYNYRRCLNAESGKPGVGGGT